MGRGGLGAVMGSKNLRALVVRGTKKIAFSNESGLTERMAGVCCVTFSRRAMHHVVSGVLDAACQFLHRFYEMSTPCAFSWSMILATPAPASGRNQTQALALFRPINTAPLVRVRR